eukprot:1411624-Amphidinium_carterae.1
MTVYKKGLCLKRNPLWVVLICTQFPVLPPVIHIRDRQPHGAATLVGEQPWHRISCASLVSRRRSAIPEGDPEFHRGFEGIGHA